MLQVIVQSLQGMSAVELIDGANRELAGRQAREVEEVDPARWSQEEVTGRRGARPHKRGGCRIIRYRYCLAVGLLGKGYNRMARRFLKTTLSKHTG